MNSAGGGDKDQTVGELFDRLIDDGRAYARAEFNLARLKTELMVGEYRQFVILGLIALLLALGAIVALAMALVLSLASLIGPLAGGLVATLLVGGAAAAAGYYAKKAFDRATR